MASSSSTSGPVPPETPITIKITVNGIPKKFKLPIGDLIPSVLPAKLRSHLNIPDHQAAVFERYSDSSGTYVDLSPSNLHAYKTLYRAAKAKLKLRLRASLGPITIPASSALLSNDTINSLSMLKFGSEATLLPVAGPSAPPATATVAAAAASSSSTTEEPSSSDTTTVAAAIATLCGALDGTKLDVNTPAKPESSSTMPELAPLFNQGRVSHGGLRPMASTSRCSAPAAQDPFKSHPAFLPTSRSLALRMSNPPNLPSGATFSWSVYCNECNKNMLEEHFHCSLCERGDFDLCTTCVNNGKHCKDENHWLVKRYLTEGKVVNGTTTRVSAKPKLEEPKEMPGAFTDEKKVEEAPESPTRTCNCCVRVFEEHAFVTCSDCDDYDLCLPCLETSKHGHHPAHTFYPATGLTPLTSTARALCKSGRNVGHEAICDECNIRIVGVRHKCLVCPDWDYCSTCIKKAPLIHRGHRFAPVFDPVAPQCFTNSPTHVSVYCDGPLCKNKHSFITGIRYKCAVCPDTDFCASCEALPHLEHNKTHPLLKFRTPVRGCSITTLVGDETVRPAATEQAPTTHIRTVAEVKPTEAKSVKEKIEIKDLLAEPVQEKLSIQSLLSKPSPAPAPAPEKEPEVKTGELQAFFVRDTISDGTVFAPEKQFTQVWTLKNPGPHTWPAGCSVRYAGGDNMLNVDDSRPSCDADFSKATESNIVRRPVQVGEEISFRVLMKAPKREGVAIAYWRLKAADGTPFGHRLWCHINVASPSPSVQAEQDSLLPREVGRLGCHENFLQYFLSEQAKQQNEAKNDMSAELRAYTQKAHQSRMRAFQESLRQKLRSRMQEELERRSKLPIASSSVEAALSAAQKVEKPEPVEMPTEKSVVADKPADMVFPTLEKESPSSSRHEEQPAAIATVTEESSTVATPAIAAEEEAELFEDAESISLSSDDDSGFLTEEEYDILNASDEE